MNFFQQPGVIVVFVESGEHLTDQLLLSFRILLPQALQQAGRLCADPLRFKPEADPGPV